MSKYDALKVLKETKARVPHRCFHCGSLIAKGDIYYREHISDRFLHSPNAKAYCQDCFTQFGESLLKSRLG
jgi:DNA-directed RNA polymerase subunit N (RpoN/RPB10)